MSNLFNLQGVGVNQPPGVTSQSLFAQGDSSIGSTTYRNMIWGNFTGSNAVAGTVYGPDTTPALQTASDAAFLMGSGTPSYRMFVDHIATGNKVNPLYWMAVASASGGTDAYYTLNVTTAGTQTTGSIQVTIGVTAFVVSFGAADTTGKVAVAIVNAINSNPTLSCTASVAGGTSYANLVATSLLTGSIAITITLKTPGARGNFYQLQCTVVTGSGILLNGVSDTGVVNFSGGVGSDLAGYQTGISNLLNGTTGQNLRYYNHMLEAGGDQVDGYNVGGTGNLIVNTFLSTYVDVLQQASNGVTCKVFVGSVDSEPHTSTACGFNTNDPRGEVVCLPTSDLPPCQLVVRYVGARTSLETAPLTPAGYNFDDMGATPSTIGIWNIPAPRNGTAPSQATINAAVVQGVSILKVLGGGRTKLVKACTQEFWVGQQGSFDPRIVDPGKLTLCDYLRDDLNAAYQIFIGGTVIGTSGSGGTAAPGVVNQKRVYDRTNQILIQYGNNGMIDYNRTIKGLKVQQGTSPTTMIQVLLPVFTADCLHQIQLLILNVN